MPVPTISFNTAGAAGTKTVAARVAREVLSTLRVPGQKGSCVLSLEGPLGAGKTTFTQGFARALGIREKVASPTFVLMKRFGISPKKLSHAHLYHIDAYRLSGGDDLIPLQSREIFRDRRAIVLVEWGDRVKTALPRNRWKIFFSHLGKNRRNIRVVRPRQA